MASESKVGAVFDRPDQPVEYVVQMHVQQSTAVITAAIEKETNTVRKEISIGQDAIKDAVTTAFGDVDKITESQNGVVESVNHVVESVNHLAEEQGEVQNLLKKQTQQMNQQVAHSEHISYKVRGQLGAQERKRRKVDLEEIGRLRTDLGVLKRQLRDKDRVIDEQMQEMKSQINTLLELVRILVARGN